jgi:protein TonB
VSSHTTPFAAIIESQPPWWRLGGGGVLVVVAYLGLLLGAFSLGGRAKPAAAPTPPVHLVVTLFDRPHPIELPGVVKATEDSGDTATLAPHSSASPPHVAAAPLTKPKPKLSPKETPAVTSAAPPRAEPAPTMAPLPAAAPEVSAAGARSAPGGSLTTSPSEAMAHSAPHGTGTGTGTTSGTPSVAAGRVRTGNDVTVLPFTDGMTRPKLLEMVEPQYTREARDANVKGLFLAKCVISTQGSLQKCRVVKGLPMMDQAVLSALARWRYTPVIYQGKPVAVDYVIQVRLAGP